MEPTRYRAYICLGPNCGPKDSAQLLGFLEEEVRRAGLDEQVSVLPTGCQAHCESGPTMVVYPGPVYYQGIDANRLRRIVAEHFVSGKPVEEYFWTGVKRRIIPQPHSLDGGVEATQSPQTEGPSKGRKPAQKPKRSYEEVDDFKW